MNEFLIFTAMMSLFVMMFCIRKSTLTMLIKLPLVIGLFILATSCLVGVYGVIGGIICTFSCAMVAGLLTAFIAGKAIQLTN